MSDQHGTHVTTVVSDPASHIDTHDDVTMSTIQTMLAALKEGSSLVGKLPYVTPFAGLLLQAPTMREVRQYEEFEIVAHKLARIAKTIVNVCELCEKHILSEEVLPGSLQAILVLSKVPLFSDYRAS
ncbi:hypothetical protein EDB85DRAFT_2140612 [Lactarius pseudohatsudake]|nr:hypothetical protein EDB85DRAFT_2140612 [Lactarius pseudohatsudake]